MNVFPLFKEALPGTPGRRLARHLDIDRVARALMRAASPAHNMKFTPRWRSRKLPAEEMGGAL